MSFIKTKRILRVESAGVKNAEMQEIRNAERLLKAGHTKERNGETIQKQTARMKHNSSGNTERTTQKNTPRTMRFLVLFYQASYQNQISVSIAVMSVIVLMDIMTTTRSNSKWFGYVRHATARNIQQSKALQKALDLIRGYYVRNEKVK